MGFCFTRGRVKISTTLPSVIFDELKARAIRNNRSISSQIGDYIEVGLAVDEQMEEPLPPPEGTQG